MHNNCIAADFIKILMLMQRLLATAEHEIGLSAYSSNRNKEDPQKTRHDRNERYSDDVC